MARTMIAPSSTYSNTTASRLRSNGPATTDSDSDSNDARDINNNTTAANSTTDDDAHAVVDNRPPPILQRLNVWIHQEPLSSIMYGVSWALFLFLSAPSVIVFLLGRTLVMTLLWMWRKIIRSNEDQFYHPSETSKSLIYKNNSNTADKELAVVITGCDNGFGAEIALRTAQEGYIVFAGCSDRKSFAQFRDMSKCIIPLQLDVTSEDQVEQAARDVQAWLDHQEDRSNNNNQSNRNRKQRILHALLNNAGVGTWGEIDWLKMQDFQVSMEVNYFGMVRCCKALIPIFKRQAIEGTHMGARILNLITMAGLTSGGQGLAAYHASKHAAQAFTTCLRQEMEASFGIYVTAIHPTFHKSMHHVSLRMWDSLTPELRIEYGEEFFQRSMVISEDSPHHGAMWDMDVVVDKILRNLAIKCPPREDLIGTDARFSLSLARMLPAWLVEPTGVFTSNRPVPAVMVSRRQSKQRKSQQQLSLSSSSSPLLRRGNDTPLERQALTV